MNIIISDFFKDELKAIIEKKVEISKRRGYSVKTVEIEIRVQNGGLNWNELYVYDTLTFELTTYEETYKKVNENINVWKKILLRR